VLRFQIKDYRRADKISAGPQSHILEGVTWDEANRLKDANVSKTGELLCPLASEQQIKFSSFLQETMSF
jgi:hypothetical protein